MPILVTAFSSFGGRETNASSLVLRELRKTIPSIRTRILPVDSVLAPSRLRQAIFHIRPSAIIMLGEAAGSTSIRLESTAWNEKDFLIPDVAGRMPIGIPIRRGAPKSMVSTLPLRAIHRRIESLGHPVSFSDDPGRYLCNQLFFTALDFLKTEGLSIPAGFIHLPLESNFPTSAATEAIAAVLNLTSTEKSWLPPGVSPKK